MKGKIVFILGSLGRGGAERVISILSKYYAERGWNTDIILLLYNNIDYTLHNTTRVIDFSGTGTSRWLRLPYWLKMIRKYVIQNNPDVVLSFAARINIIVQIACYGLKKRIVVSERNDPYCDGRNVLVDSLTKFLYSKADAVVYQTKRAASYFDKCKLNNAVIIPNPISVNHFAEEPLEGKIVTVGRLTKQKNQTLLINAFRSVSEKYPFAKLYLYGDGELKDDLQKLATQLGLDNKIFFMGNVSNVHEQIANAAMFVLSSDYEGLSNALLEAMMMGLACISTNCAGSNEYIMDHENGLLVDVNDQTSLTSAMLSLLSNRQLTEKLAQNAHNSSYRFAKEQVLQRWYDLINEGIVR